MTGPMTAASTDFAQRAVLAEDRLRALSMLIAGVTHEINNPLTAIQGLVSLLRTECDEPENREDLDIVLTETERTVRIVRNLRAFAGHADEPQLSQLNDAVRQVVDARGYEIHARGIDIELDLAADLSYVAATGPDLLYLTLQLILWAEQTLLGTPPRDAGNGPRAVPHMTVRTRVDEINCRAQLTAEHDGSPLPAGQAAALAAEAGPDRTAALAPFLELQAMDHAATSLGGVLAGGNLQAGGDGSGGLGGAFGDRGAWLTVSIPMVGADGPDTCD